MGRVDDRVETYRLRSDDLKNYLQTLFPNQAISVKLSEDGKTYYTFKIPRKLTEEEKEYIKSDLRYDNPSQDVFSWA